MTRSWLLADHYAIIEWYEMVGDRTTCLLLKTFLKNSIESPWWSNQPLQHISFYGRKNENHSDHRLNYISIYIDYLSIYIIYDSFLSYSVPQASIFAWDTFSSKNHPAILGSPMTMAWRRSTLRWAASGSSPGKPPLSRMVEICGIHVWVCYVLIYV